jgi:hypothetical protein
MNTGLRCDFSFTQTDPKNPSQLQIQFRFQLPKNQIQFRPLNSSSTSISITMPKVRKETRQETRQQPYGDSHSENKKKDKNNKYATLIVDNNGRVCNNGRPFSFLVAVACLNRKCEHFDKCHDNMPQNRDFYRDLLIEKLPKDRFRFDQDKDCVFSIIRDKREEDPQIEFTDEDMEVLHEAFEKVMKDGARCMAYLFTNESISFIWDHTKSFEKHCHQSLEPVLTEQDKELAEKFVNAVLDDEGVNNEIANFAMFWLARDGDPTLKMMRAALGPDMTPRIIDMCRRLDFKDLIHLVFGSHK